MKICILGDNHFGGGFSLGRTCPIRQLNTRLLDQSDLFDFTIDYCVEHGIRHLILTGDVFDHRRPQASETALFSEKMARTSELNIHTHIVVGNHDITMAQNATTLDFLDELNLPYVHVYSDISSKVIEEGDEKANLIFFPYRTRKMLKCRTNAEAIERLRERLNYETKNMSDGAKILVGHLMLEGTNIAPSVLESSLSELVLPLDMFRNLDAAIMGHVHPHQIIRRNPLIGYIGSMGRNKFDEGRQKKYLLVIDQGKELTFTFEPLPNRELYDITIDQSDAETGEDVAKGVRNYMKEFGKVNSLSGSIVRLQVHITEKALYGFHADDLISYFRNELKIHHCVGVFTQVTSKRQLRKETITEMVEPQDAFDEFLELEDDSDVKERVRELGTRIISSRGA